MMKCLDLDSDIRASLNRKFLGKEKDGGIPGAA